MAKEIATATGIKRIEDMTLDELTIYTARVQAQTAAYALDDQKAANEKRASEEADKRRRNAQRQAELKEGREQMAAVQSRCRHRQGGTPSDIYKGNMAPCVVRTRMLDGVTYLLQCLRCRLRVLTPHPSLEQASPKEFKRQTEIYEKLWEMTEDSINSTEIKTGPVFMFKKNGVPFIPLPPPGIGVSVSARS